MHVLHGETLNAYPEDVFAEALARLMRYSHLSLDGRVNPLRPFDALRASILHALGEHHPSRRSLKSDNRQASAAEEERRGEGGWGGREKERRIIDSLEASTVRRNCVDAGALHEGLKPLKKATTVEEKRRILPLVSSALSGGFRI